MNPNFMNNVSPQQFEQMKNMINPETLKTASNMFNNMSDDQLQQYLNSMGMGSMNAQQFRAMSQNLGNMNDSQLNAMKNQANYVNYNMMKNNFNNNYNYNNNNINANNANTSTTTNKQTSPYIEKLNKMKGNGNDLFRNKKYEEACDIYYKIIEEIEISDDDKVKEFKNELNDIERATRLNIAACKLNLKDYDTVIKECSTVLENNKCFKAYYRMGMAYLNKKEFQKAYRYLDNANALANPNEKKDVEKYIVECKEELDKIKIKKREERLQKEKEENEKKKADEEEEKNNDINNKKDEDNNNNNEINNKKDEEEKKENNDNDKKQENIDTNNNSNEKENKKEKNSRLSTFEETINKEKNKNKNKKSNNEQNDVIDTSSHNQNENDDDIKVDNEINTNNNSNNNNINNNYYQNSSYQQPPFYGMPNMNQPPNYQQCMDQFNNMSEDQLNFLGQSIQSMDNETIKNIMKAQGMNMTDEDVNRMKSSMNPDTLKMMKNMTGGMGSNYSNNNNNTNINNNNYANNPNVNNTQNINNTPGPSIYNNNSSQNVNNTSNNGQTPPKMPPFPDLGKMDYQSMFNYLKQNPQILNMISPQLSKMFGGQNVDPNVMMNAMDKIMWIFSIPSKIKKFFTSFKGICITILVIGLIIAYFKR